MPTRRQFLTQVTFAGAAEFASTRFSIAQGKTLRAAKPLQVLVLGGTGFIGPRFVQAAVERGHRVWAFIYRPNADKDIAALPAGVEPLLGSYRHAPNQWSADFYGLVILGAVRSSRARELGVCSWMGFDRYRVSL